MSLASYNETDPFAAEWLRNLIFWNHIAPGIVDERSIEDIAPAELQQYDQCHFFAGIGVWSYALRCAGWPDDRPIWTGSCPCQPFSSTGKGGGFADERHLWPAFHWLIDQCRPDVVLGEQVANKDGLTWFDLVSSDLEGTGYTCGAVDLCAAGFGGPHIRQRNYWCALVHAPSEQVGLPGRAWESGGADADGRDAGAEGSTLGETGLVRGRWAGADWISCRDGKWRPVEPGTFPLVTGAPNRVGRLRGYGNALCAPVAQGFIEAVMEEIDAFP